jgi:signal peptidase II
MQRSNARLFWPILIVIIVADVITKALAVRMLIPQRVPHDLLGSWVRLTLVYNPGAAFGLHVGNYSRFVFIGLTIVALVILTWLYRTSRQGDTPRVLALALVCAGALGNLFDRLRSELGVVDFIDIGFGATRWPTFNIADMAVSTGAFLLAWVLWDEEREEVPAGAPPRQAVESEAS